MCLPVCDVLIVFRTSTSVVGFLQTKQLISLVVFFYFAKSPATGHAHDENMCEHSVATTDYK